MKSIIRQYRNWINKYFLALAVIFSVAIYIFLASNSQSNYIAETQILISPKNEKTAIYLNNISENLVRIFGKIGQETDAEISLQKNSSLLTIKAVDITSFRSLEKTKQAVREFLDVASKYYNVSDDLSFRIVDVNVFQEKNNLFWLTILSIFLGIILALAMQPIIFALSNVFIHYEYKRTANKFDISTDKISEEKKESKSNLQNILENSREKIKSLSEDAPLHSTIDVNDKFDEKFLVNTEELDSQKIDEDLPSKEYREPIQPGEDFANNKTRKSHPPQNLPIFAGEENDNFEIPEDKPQTIGSFSQRILNKRSKYHKPIVETSNQEQNIEPSEEEYKRRLNELLQGE